MTLTDQDRRDRIDAAAATLDDIGMPTLAARLRDVIDELLPPTAPDTRTPGQTSHDVIARHMANRIIHEDPKGQAENIATEALAALTAAGYAVVRLPEPDGHSSTGAPAWGTIPYPVYAEPNRVDLDTTPIEAGDARDLAAALLAAANHQENNQ